MNATTGRAIADLDHLYQSINRILSTPLGTRIARRTFGSDLPDLIDAPTNGATLVRLYAAVATALMRWEPRLQLTSVQLSADSTDAFNGALILDIQGTTDEGDTVSTSVPLTSSAAA
jgi:hypothetical protein